MARTEAAKERNRRYCQSPHGREKRKELKRNWARRRYARRQAELEEERRLDELVEKLCEPRPRRWRLPPEDAAWLAEVASALSLWSPRRV